jgi:nodulation protein E
MSEDRRVVITGMGVVSALGIGKEALLHAITAGLSGITPTTRRIGNYTITVPLGVVPDYQPLDHFVEGDLLLRDPYAQYALLAAKEAMAQAGLPDDTFVGERTAIAFGTGAGGEYAREEAAHRFLVEGKPRCNPTLVPRTNHQASVGFVSMAYGIKGPAIVVSSGCASSNHAIAQAYLMVKHGVADRALAGGSDANAVYTNIKAFDALRILASDTCRPFSRNRRGMVMGEGGGVVVLETLDVARARGATILAELAGVGMSADAGDVVHPTASGPAQAIRTALADARLNPEDIDYINAHGTGTEINDREEIRAVKLAFGAHAQKLAISSTKSMHGHALGGVGGIELVATLLAMRENVLPPTVNYLGPDPECDLDVVPNEARGKPIRAALSNAFAFGGLNAVLALRKLQ